MQRFYFGNSAFPSNMKTNSFGLGPGVNPGGPPAAGAGGAPAPAPPPRCAAAALATSGESVAPRPAAAPPAGAAPAGGGGAAPRFPPTEPVPPRNATYCLPSNIYVTGGPMPPRILV